MAKVWTCSRCEKKFEGRPFFTRNYVSGCDHPCCSPLCRFYLSNTFKALLTNYTGERQCN